MKLNERPRRTILEMSEPLPAFVDWPKEPNFSLRFGENITLSFRVKKTLTNRIKWKLFCLVFPCKIDEWEDEEVVK